MAVTIDEMQVETNSPTQPGGSKDGGSTPEPPNVKAEIEKLRERELRLHAD